MPALAYLNLKTVTSRRENSIEMPVSNRFNPPVARLRQKKLRRLQPVREVEDPYIVAVLIALAQEQRTATSALSAASQPLGTTYYKVGIDNAW